MENRPWYKYYDGIPNSLNYPKTTLYERFKQTAEKYPEAIAWEFLGSTGTYRELLADIDQFANGLSSKGFNEGDYMTISMPTSPQGCDFQHCTNCWCFGDCWACALCS